MHPLRYLPRPAQRICVIAGGFLIHLTLGTIYTVGNINPYLASYLRARVPGQQYVTYGMMSWLFAVTVCGQTVSLSLGGVLERKIGPAYSAFLGSIVMSLGVLLTYFTIQHSFWLCLLTYGLVVGVGTGLAYNPPFVCAMKWFPENRGLATGMILTGFGLGAFIFNQVQTAFVNPWNYAVDTEGYFTQPQLLDRLPSLFFLLSGTYFAIQLVGCLLLMDPPPDQVLLCPGSTRNLHFHNKQDQYDVDTNSSSTPLLGSGEVTSCYDSYDPANSTVETNNNANVSPITILKSSTFWCLWSTILLNEQLVNFVSSYFKVFGQMFIRDDYLLAAIGSVSSIFNSIGRILWGYLGDRYSYQRCMVSISALLTALIMTVYATRYFGPAAYFIWISLIFLTFSGQFSLFPMATAQAFGPVNVGVNYGLVFSSSALTAIFNAALATLLLDRLGFSGMFLLMGGSTFFALCISLAIHRSDYGSRISDGHAL